MVTGFESVVSDDFVTQMLFSGGAVAKKKLPTKSTAKAAKESGATSKQTKAAKATSKEVTKTSKAAPKTSRDTAAKKEEPTKAKKR